MTSIKQDPEDRYGHGDHDEFSSSKKIMKTIEEEIMCMSSRGSPRRPRNGLDIMSQNRALGFSLVQATPHDKP